MVDRGIRGDDLQWLECRGGRWRHADKIRDDEDAAQSCGVDVDRVKAAVFVASAAATGLAAGLYFIDVVIITPPSAFTISWSSYIVFVAVAGGMGTVFGPIIGAVLFILIERLLGAAAGQGLLLLGVLSILLMLLLPRGVMGFVNDRMRAWSAAKAKKSTPTFEAGTNVLTETPEAMRPMLRSKNEPHDGRCGSL
jgi:ABC-type branched-subunit amino acid transport system permease subunit